MFPPLPTPPSSPSLDFLLQLLQCHPHILKLVTSFITYVYLFAYMCRCVYKHISTVLILLFVTIKFQNSSFVFNKLQGDQSWKRLFLNLKIIHHGLYRYIHLSTVHSNNLGTPVYCHTYTILHLVIWSSLTILNHSSNILEHILSSMWPILVSHVYMS